MPEVTTPAEEAQSAARSARRRAERQSIRDGVMVESQPTPSEHLIALQREAAASVALDGETQSLTPEQPEEDAPEHAPEAPKATRSRRASK